MRLRGAVALVTRGSSGIGAATARALAAAGGSAPIAGRGRRGGVLVPSFAGDTGGRGEAVYAAAKAGVGYLGESLAYPLSDRGVGVSVIIPGVIDTPFFERRGTPYERKKPEPRPAERVAQAITSAIARDRSVVYVPRWMQLPAWLHGAAPGAFRVLAARFGNPG